jgi:hypothetical protein
VSAPDASAAPLRTPDGRYLIVRGRLWRLSDPSLPDDVREKLVDELMRARREVARAGRLGDEAALRTAREAVHAAKLGLGERGPVWWDDAAPDLTRRLVRNTEYAHWYAGREGA